MELLDEVQVGRQELVLDGVVATQAASYVGVAGVQGEAALGAKDLKHVEALGSVVSCREQAALGV